ncbi:ABC transporter substrate-binding protein [Roseivivax sediminis]|uniref:NitT/TauT family transport system substrate-binding protein n=1 Tax=Roseivivax sediminis TaxID=936889 RepID=A0A1I2E802_9RHOB|nr:ABC transporter substrate-binding protein [Roseivivax sediminis]SFE89062.1 NitT/TauT family transport system substrate-binding protein [Roseivivax sediminis]
MTTKTSFKALAAGTALAALTASGAAAQDFDLSGTEVTIGTAQAQVLNIGTLRMIEILQGWGADVTRVELPTISGLEAIIADRVDVASRSSDEILIGQARGVDVVAIGAPISTMHYAIVSSPGVNEIADLDGKAIGTSGPGGFNGMLFRYILKQNGLTPEEDVAIVPVGGSSERAAAILAGQVQATVVYIDNWLALEAQGANAQLLGYVSDIVPGLSSRAVFAERAYIEENAELASAIACANLEVNHWINSSKEDFVSYTMDNVRGANEEAVSKFYDVAMQIGMFPTEPAALLDTSGYQKLADLLYDGGELDTELDASGFVDASYLEEAAGMGCGTGEMSG